MYVSGLESDGDSDLTQAHVAAASGDVAMLVQAIQHDPGVIQQHDGDGTSYVTWYSLIKALCNQLPATNV